jgi:hypothetical protein
MVSQDKWQSESNVLLLESGRPGLRFLVGMQSLVSVYAIMPAATVADSEYIRQNQF